jgi:hypothetical protein
MSQYFELRNVTPEQLRDDVQNGRIIGLRNDPACVGRSADETNITDGEFYIWVIPATTATNCGLKSWGSNNPRNILLILSEYYDTLTEDEDELGLLHWG